VIEPMREAQSAGDLGQEHPMSGFGRSLRRSVESVERGSWIVEIPEGVDLGLVRLCGGYELVQIAK